MKINAKWTAPLVLLALAACGRATVESVEEELTASYSEDEAEVSWITVEENDDGSFSAILDVTGDDGGSRTVFCDVSATSVSSSRQCRSATPSAPAQIERFLQGRAEQAGVALSNLELERTDDGNVAVTGSLTEIRTGRQEAVNLLCEVDFDDRDEGGGFECDDA